MTIQEIRALIEAFDASSLSRLAVKLDSAEVELERAVAAAPAAAAITPGGSPAVPTPVPPAPTPAAPPPAAPAAPDGIEQITAPIVGTFYRRPSPDAPPFCGPGDRIDEGATLCILEAMKVMNQLEAEFAMEIVAFHVTDGDMLEFGAPIADVRRL